MNRYVNETKRLYSVLNTHLERKKSPYLVGEKCTIAGECTSFLRWCLALWLSRCAVLPGVLPLRHGVRFGRRMELEEKESMSFPLRGGLRI